MDNNLQECAYIWGYTLHSWSCICPKD